MDNIAFFIQTKATQLMVRLLSRWGFVVSFREPRVLQVDEVIDSRALALSRIDALEIRNEMALRVKRKLADAIVEEGPIELLSYVDQERMEHHLRGRFRFHPVLPA